jgi:hypothetical protein
MALVRSLALLGAVVLVVLPKASSAIGPYTPDANTLHLWHMNETAVPLADSATTAINPNTTPIPLQWINDGTTLGNASFSGFGTAADTFSSTIDPVNAPSGSLGKAPGVFGLQPAQGNPGGLADDVPTATFWNQTTGAFTYEALLKVVIDPATIIGDGDISVPGSYGVGSSCHILTMDNESLESGRGFQFLINKYLDGKYALEYVAITGGDGTTQVSSPLPELQQGKWYHAAITYDGNAAVADSMKFYWTEVTPTTTSATLVSSGVTLSFPPLATGSDLGIGNEGRAGQTGNWMGLIDEVRVSDIARGANQFVFANPSPPTAHPGDFDGDGDVDGADFVAWQTNFPKASGATLAQGDADADGDVDGADFVVWQTNFPFTPGPASAIPEPSGIILIVLGAMALVSARRMARS